MKPGIKPAIIGQHVNLYPLSQEPEDIIRYTNWVNDQSYNGWVNQNTKPHTYESEVEYATKVRPDTDCVFLIAEKSDDLPSHDTPIGTCSISQRGQIPANNWALGILIGEESGRDHGLGTETVRMLVDFAFNERNAHRVELSACADNERAIKCYTKAGFTICGTDHEAFFVHGRYVDRVRMEILRSDWEALKLA